MYINAQAIESNESHFFAMFVEKSLFSKIKNKLEVEKNFYILMHNE